jgi:hypothetical protein
MIIFCAKSKMGQCLSAATPVIADEIRDVILPDLAEHILPKLEEIINKKIDDAISISTEKASA